MIRKYFVTDRPGAYQHLDGFFLVHEPPPMCGRWVMYDVETRGLNPRTKEMLLAQTFDGTSLVIYEDLRKLRFSKGKTYVAHNAKFEYNWTKEALGVLLEDLYCTMLAWKVVNGARDVGGYGLNDVLGQLGLEGVDDKYELQMSFANHQKGRTFSQAQLDYAGDDVVKLWPLFHIVRRRVAQRKLQRAVALENEFLKAAADLENHGINLDWEGWGKLTKELRPAEEKALKELGDYLFENHGEACDKTLAETAGAMVLFRPPQPINWRSVPQKLRLFNNLGVRPKDKYGKPTTSSKIMQRFSRIPWVELYIKWADMQKSLTTYNEKWASPDPVSGRVHTGLNTIVGTGRTSSTNPNIQNIPSDEVFRSKFVAAPGHKLLNPDYPSQEPRVTADKSGDDELINFFVNRLHGGDMHSFVAQKASGLEVPPKEEDNPEAMERFKNHPNAKLRNAYKHVNLGLDYGLTAFSLAFEMQKPIREMEKMVDAVKAVFPGKTAYQERCKEFLFSHGYIETNPLIRRRVYFEEEVGERNRLLHKSAVYGLTKEEKSRLGSLTSRLGNKAMNYPTQSTSADMTKWAALWIRRQIIKKGLPLTWDGPVRLVNFVHDELLYEVREDLVEWFAPVLKAGMDRAASLFLYRVPMVVQVKISDKWEK